MGGRLLWLAAAVACATVSAGAPGEILPFVEDDYDRAVAEARARDLPLFVEAWAPW